MNLNSISLADVRPFTFVAYYHESWQNDICSFRAMNVALSLSFKLISFLHLYQYHRKKVNGAILLLEFRRGAHQCWIVNYNDNYN